MIFNYITIARLSGDFCVISNSYLVEFELTWPVLELDLHLTLTEGNILKLLAREDVLLTATQLLFDFSSQYNFSKTTFGSNKVKRMEFDL